MKNFLWIALTLILVFLLFLWLKPKGVDAAQSGQEQTQIQTTQTVATSNSGDVTAPVVVAAAQENAVDEVSLQLGSYTSLQGGWVKAPPPGSSVVAAYMKFANSGRAAVKIVSVESDDFEDMMFHRSVIENGVASMQHVEYLEVPNGGSLVLEPSGLHIMAMEPQRALKAGDQVSISFTFDNGQIYSATLPVR